MGQITLTGDEQLQNQQTGMAITEATLQDLVR